MNENVKTIARINDVSIQIVENGDRFVPIKPICEALNIDYKNQYEKIKSDEFLASTMVLSTTVGADGKQREMTTIPYKYIFGWLFTINPKNVKPEAKESVMQYRMECYDVLYNHFTQQSQFLEEKQKAIGSQLDKVKDIRQKFNSTKQELKKAQDMLDQVRNTSFEEWKSDKSQLTIQFPASDSE